MGDNQKEQFDLVVDKGSVITRQKTSGRQVLKKGDASWYYLGIVGQIGFSIAIPIAGGALLGSYLDTQWHTYPRATLGLLLFGVFLSFVTFYRTIKSVLEKK